MRLNGLCGCDEVLCHEYFEKSISRSQFDIFTIIHLQISHIVSAHWLYILQMSYNLRRGRGNEDEEQPPPPPPPALAELMQTVVEGQRMLADAMRQLANREARQGR
jgi:hypothetical protein